MSQCVTAGETAHVNVNARGMRMTDTLITKFSFEEVKLAGEGLMAWGVATLEGDEDAFQVTEIVLQGGKKLLPDGAAFMGIPCPQNRTMFDMIATVLENDPAIKVWFAEQLEGEAEKVFRPEQHGTYSAMNGRAA